MSHLNFDFNYFQAGPDWTASINKELDEEEASLKAIRQDEIDGCMQTIAEEETAQANTAAYADIIAAKKEAVALQLEGVYRARLQDAYTQVWRRNGQGWLLNIVVFRS